MDYNEEQQSEIEAIQAIYNDEFIPVSEKPFHSFNVEVTTDDYEEGTENGAKTVIGFKFVEKYPDEPPEIVVQESENISAKDTEELLEYLISLANSNTGMVMVFTLVSATQDWLHDRKTEIQTLKQQETINRARAAEEAERKRFEGTVVTVESFLTWQAKFEAEMAAIKSQQLKEDLGVRKLTGRELFEKDHTLNESDIQFLQDGEEDIKVDESLFQEMDDLDLDELVSDEF